MPPHPSFQAPLIRLKAAKSRVKKAIRFLLSGIAAIAVIAPDRLFAAPEPATVFVHTATENYYVTTLNH